MRILSNPYRGLGLQIDKLETIPLPSIAAERTRKLMARCPEARQTPLLLQPEIAAKIGIGKLLVKDERNRMGLGSFKALGAAYVIARDAENGPVSATTYIAASAGNHGLSVAAGARAFGARAVIYLAETVPEAFAERLRALGAKVVRHGTIYEASMEGAEQAAKLNNWELLSDSSWVGYTDRPHTLMEGYLALAAEVTNEVTNPPTHVFLQAGVGGLAGALAAYFRTIWGSVPIIVVVEPDAAPALAASIQSGRPVVAEGPVSAMGRLDCKEPSLIALKGLAIDADFFATITEEEAEAGDAICRENALSSTPSGAAGISAILAAKQLSGEAIQLGANSCALVILSEGPEG